MTTLVRNDVIFNSSTDVEFRAWAQAIRDGLSAVGMVRTADTGQINLTTVPRAAAGGSAGYDIFRFADGLQDTRPVFLKIEYGASGTTSVRPAVFITVGGSTNGAGTISSAMATARRTQSQNSTNTASQQAFFAGDGSYLSVMLPGTFGLLLTIERTRNANGTANTDGLLITSRSVESTTYILSVLSYLNNTVSEFAGEIASVPGIGFGTAPSGSDVTIFPRLILLPKLEYDLGTVFAYTNDIVNNTQYPIVNLGATHTYMSFNTASSPLTNLSSFTALVRFE